MPDRCYQMTIGSTPVRIRASSPPSLQTLKALAEIVKAARRVDWDHWGREKIINPETGPG